MPLAVERVFDVGGGVLQRLQLVGLSRPDGGAAQARQNGVRLAAQKIRFLGRGAGNNDAAKLGARAQVHAKNNVADAGLRMWLESGLHVCQEVSAAAQIAL